MSNDQNEEQLLPPPQQPSSTTEFNQPGRTAQSSAGQVGQRQTQLTAAEQAGVQPMARISNRIQNRVRNRIRNRIDRNYSPFVADPFAVAEDQARSAGRPR